jgi:hypothetical protein
VAELAFLSLATAFTVWVVLLGGAEWLEGTLKSAFLVHSFAPYWNATGIKVYVTIAWAGILISAFLL